jgi:hypothetical protein
MPFAIVASGRGSLSQLLMSTEMDDSQRTDPDFPDDDGTRSITSEAYRLAERAYVKNQGQAYFEDLLIRATIGLCRKSYLDD